MMIAVFSLALHTALHTALPSALAATLVVDDGHAIHAVLAVQPFTLTTPYAYDWSASHFQVKAGTILVLESDPIWLIPSDSKQAVLYVGDTPCERLNPGFPDGRLVVIVPSGPDLTVGADDAAEPDVMGRTVTAAGAITFARRRLRIERRKSSASTTVTIGRIRRGRNLRRRNRPAVLNIG